MKRILIIILLCLFTISCKEKSTKDKLIDIGPFSFTVPHDFEYKKLQGIDSFVGEITNGETTFSFDYGKFSPKPPMTEQEFLAKNSETLNLGSLHLLLKKIDPTPYQNDDGSVSLQEIDKRIKNLELKQNTENIKFSMYPDKEFKYYYSLKFDDKQYNFPFFGYEVHKNNIKNFTIKTDTINNYKRTISIYNKKDNTENDCVFFKDLKDDSLFSQLWFGIPSNHKLSEELLKKILNSVKMNNKKTF